MKGSIQRRGTRYRVVIDKGLDDTGRRRQIVRSAGTREAAATLRNELLAEHGAGIEHNGDTTVGELLFAKINSGAGRVVSLSPLVNGLDRDVKLSGDARLFASW